MRVLAADTSSATGGLAALDDKRLLGHIFTESKDDYEVRFFREAKQLLEELGLELSDFDVYAVAAGPGSFTGLRVGLTAVKAWSELYQKAIAAVSGLQAVALQSAEKGAYVAAVLDARRGQVYGALFRTERGRLAWVGEEVVMSPEQFVAEVSQRLREAGAERVVFVSPQPELIAEALAASELRDARVEKVSGDLAPWIGQLAQEQAEDAELVDGLSLDANYIRRTDAESYWSDGNASPAAISVRPLQASDARAIAELERQCKEVAQWGEGSYQQIREGGLQGWGAFSNGELVGFVVERSIGGEMEILNMAVHPQARRKKIGRRLIAEVFSHGAKSNVTRAYLEVRESNEAARKFYAGHGFTETRRRKRYYSNPVEDGLILSKDLQAKAAK